MLSQKTMEIIQSTAPILAERGTEITSHFYKRMFQNHPELLNIFNHANQQKGRQQTSLANTLYAAASHIDQLESILPVVKQIGHKHRSLGVRKEHYPIVGENLLAAMKEVLQEAATKEVITAWAEAYEVIANVFIDVEEEMYNEAESKSGGWRYFKPFVVSNKVKESDLITSFYLKPKDGTPLPSFLPGQYITVQLSIEGEAYKHNRQYSLSHSANEEWYRISVKREADSNPRGKVSNWLHDHVQVGDELLISPPAGDFTLTVEEKNPVVLISGGVGITPMMSMLHTVANENSSRPVTFIHAAKHEGVHAFRDEVTELMKKIEQGKWKTIYENREGYVTTDHLRPLIDKKADIFLCGPVSFMKAVLDSLSELNVPKEQIHYEFFGPALTEQQMNSEQVKA